MTEYHSLNVKLSNSQLNKLKSAAVKNSTEVTQHYYHLNQLIINKLLINKIKLLITQTVGIIDWAIDEINQLDIKNRKTLALTE